MVTGRHYFYIFPSLLVISHTVNKSVCDCSGKRVQAGRGEDTAREKVAMISHRLPDFGYEFLFVDEVSGCPPLPTIIVNHELVVVVHFNYFT